MKYKYNGQWYDLTVPAFDSLPVGAIMPYAGSVLPNGYLWCDGNQYLKTDKNDLYGKIGDRYNLSTDTDNTKFRVPNIKGRVLVGLDTSQTEFDTLGETGGSKYLQDHGHKGASLGGNELTSWSTTGSEGIFDLSSIFKPNQPNNNKLDIGGVNTNATPVGDSGNLQPYIVVNYIIKASPSAINTSEVVNEHSDSETNVYSANRTNIEIENAVKDIYSTSEVKTNKVWIDGKPIYRKVLHITNIPRGYQEYNHNINNLGVITNVYGYIYLGTTYQYNPITRVVADNISGEGFGILNITNTKIHTLAGTSMLTTNNAYIILEYTKTTD